MKLSVSVTNYSWPHAIADRIAALARTLDDTAVDTLWVPDHLLQADLASRLDEPMLEAYTSLGYLAAVTSRIRLGTMVTAATFRAPALLIKAVTTLDALSAGRAWHLLHPSATCPRAVLHSRSRLLLKSRRDMRRPRRTTQR